MTRKRRFKLEKLVRDKIPEILSQKEVTIKERTLSQSEYIHHLKLKLVEEVQEVIESRNITDLLEEISDVWEVILALAAAHSISLEELEQKRVEKRNTTGAFAHRIYGEYIECGENNKHIEYYLTRPGKYPETSSF